MEKRFILISMLEKFNKFFIKRVVTLFILFFAVNIIAIAPSLNIFVDIFSHFRVQYFFISFLFLFLFIYLVYFNKKFVIGIILSLFIILLNSFFIFQNYQMPSKVPAGRILKFGLFNVNSDNRRMQLLLDEIYDNKPDIIILQEVNEAWLTYVQGLKSEYPYYKECPRDDNFGIAFYSKIPLKNADVQYWGNHFVPVIAVDIDDIKIYCVHTLPPANYEYLETRNQMLQRIGKILKDASLNGEKVIAAGDFNTTKFSNAYRTFILSNNIFDVVNYLPKYKGSWNAFHPPFFRITLEHILSTKNIVPVKVHFEKHFGSDHLPIFAEFNILN